MDNMDDESVKMEESNNNITSAENLGPYFLKHDNSIDTSLVSAIPSICKEEPCILGVDEAGRGPVLGPMVYGISYCPLSKADDLKALGCADSKTLTEQQREALFEKLCSAGDYVGWAVNVISPNSICNSMLRRQKYSLNQVSQDAAVGLIKQAQELGVRVSEVYVDTVGMPEKYQEKLSEIFPHLKITVEKKADATFPIVSAASICAKVCRDRALGIWKFKEGLDIEPGTWGSGYPNDPVTKAFLKKNIDPVFGYPQLVRFSWSTADKILQEEAVPVEWEDEDSAEPPNNNTSILSFFKRESGGKVRSRHNFFVARNLSTTEIF